MFDLLDTIDCDACQSEWVFGSAGICNETSETCICPSGFSGRDFIVVSPTCHVNESLQTLIYQLSIIVLAICLFPLCKAHNVLYNAMKKECSIASLNTKQVVLFTFIALVFGIIHICSLIIMFSIMGFNKDISTWIDSFILLTILFFIVLVSQGISLSCFYLSWFYSIPDPIKYGGLLNYPVIIQDYPRLIPRLLYLNIFVWFSYSVVSFGFSKKFDDDVVGVTPLKLFSFANVLGMLALIISIFVIVSGLSRIYNGALESLGPSEESGLTINSVSMSLTTSFESQSQRVYSPLQKHVKHIQTLLSRLRWMLPMVVLLQLLTIVSNVFLHFSGGLNQYIALSTTSLFMAITTALFAYSTVMNKAGGYLLPMKP